MSPRQEHVMFEVLGFLLGVHLTIALIASCYRIIDLWYCIKDHVIEVVARIAINLTLIFLIYSLADSKFCDGFLIGQIFLFVFHVKIFWTGSLLMLYMKHFL